MPFTGTPDEIRLKGFLNDLFIQNELGGASPYVLSFAKAGKSGYSFGVPQFDLSSNTDGQNVLKAILENATTGGAFIVDDGNPATGRSNDTEVLRLYGLAIQPGGISLNASDKAKINQVLGSSYGIQAVDAALDPHLGTLLNKANAVINLTSGLDRAFLESDLGKLFLSDFGNQYGITLPGGALAQFVQGQTVFGIVKQGVLGVDDLLNFYFRTQQSKATPHDPIRRFGHIVEIVGYTPSDLQEAMGVLRAYTSFVVPNRGQIVATSAGSTALNVFMNLVVQPARVPVIATYAPSNLIDGDVLIGSNLGNRESLPGNDLLLGENRYNNIHGQSGNDVIYGGNVGDDLFGDAGDDWIYGGLGGDTLNGGDDGDVLEGQEGRDTLAGGNGIDLLRGGTEDDTLIGGTGDDMLEGGAGFDTYIYNLGDGADTIIDSDGKGQVKLKGQVLTVGLHHANDPSNVYRSADGTITLTKTGNDLVITGSGPLTIKNFDFTNGMLGIGVYRVRSCNHTFPGARRAPHLPLPSDPASLTD